jgi:hypothetical protein
MLYVVEVPVIDRDLTAEMNRMRTWLDGARFEPSGFRLWPADSPQNVRVSFKIEAEAKAFAAEFGGSLLVPSITAAALA